MQFVLKWHSLEAREKAAGLIERGHGCGSVASALAISESVAHDWVSTYRAVGREAFLSMGSKHRRYSYETKLAAARDYVDGGMAASEVMSRYGVVNRGQVTDWARAYREGGPEALRPRPKGRPAGPPTREEELEAENRRLRAEVAYLKKLRALEAAGRAPGRSAR